MSGFATEKVTEDIAKLKVGGSAPDSSSSTGAAAASATAAMSQVASMKNVNEVKQCIMQQQIAALLKKIKKKEGSETHKFWDTQPMAKKDAVISELVNEAIDKNTDPEQVRQTPYSMPAGFEWCEIDVHDEGELQEFYALLAANYVEDDGGEFRFDYSKEFLMWALTVPNYRKDWHVGVRSPAKDGKPGKLMASITAVPALLQVHGVQMSVVEINFLCVHKKLRDKRLSPMLIREITRRVNLTGRWQAVYTAGALLPGCKARCRYWHRTLQPEKLIEVKFSFLPMGKTMPQHVADLDLPKKPLHAFRPMLESDVSQVTALLNTYLRTLKMSQIFEEHEVSHVLLPRENVMNSYVVQGDDGVITDFASFYNLKSSILKSTKYSELLAVYSYYNVAGSMSYEELVTDLLILAKNQGVDVFNALDLMENQSVFGNLKFGRGDGALQYYVYNWNCAQLTPQEVGLVLV